MSADDDAIAAAHFAQGVARLLAPPGAEDDAVRHLRAEDLPDLLTHLRERLAQARAEGEAAGAARERAATQVEPDGLRAELAQVRADARLMAAELTVSAGLWQSCMEAADWYAIHPDHDVIAVLSRAEIAAVIRRCAALPSIRPAGWAAGGAR